MVLFYYSTFRVNFATTHGINMTMIDLHNDALLKLPPEQLLPYLRQAKIAGFDEIWLSVWTTELTDPLATIRAKKNILTSITGDPAYPICRLHIEDAGFLTPDNLDQLVALQPHSVGLTWNHDNNLAGGAHGHGQITPFGRQVIQKLEAANIQIDTAHLNRRSFWQFARLTTRPLVCTHTAFNAVCPHPRNLTNRQVRAIIKSQGMIGLALVPQFLTKTPTSCDIYDLLKHISYAKQHFNSAIIHWGTDFYGTDHLPAHLQSYDAIRYLFNTRIIGHSVLHQPIIAYQIGKPTAARRLLITAGMHAREWIGALTLQTWLNHAPTIPADTCLTAVVCCNPDGVKLATGQPLHLAKRRRKFLIHANRNNTDFSLWKANLRGVDLNVNFDAGWGQGRSNLTMIAPANYIGPEPHSEPENRALLRLIRNYRPTTSLAIHTKGNVIYYSRLEDQQTAEQLGKLTGYSAELSDASYGGLTDYLALRCQVPSFTVELGDDSLKHPIGKENLTDLLPKLDQIINYFLIGE
ncbi:MAG: membrane dipeptidase [Eubacteriales bacterium]|nr:membrane dipeptidase [Eubacteriales bacterium]